jgi:hypothetical protein
MEMSDSVELNKRDKFFQQEDNEIHVTLLRALCELSKGKTFVWIEDIDERIFGSRHPNAEIMREVTKPPDERYTGHFTILHKKGYLRLSSIKVYLNPRAYDWYREGGPI